MESERADRNGKQVCQFSVQMIKEEKEKKRINGRADLTLTKAQTTPELKMPTKSHNSKSIKIEEKK